MGGTWQAREISLLLLPCACPFYQEFHGLRELEPVVAVTNFWGRLPKVEKLLLSPDRFTRRGWTLLHWCAVALAASRRRRRPPSAAAVAVAATTNGCRRAP